MPPAEGSRILDEHLGLALARVCGGVIVAVCVVAGITTWQQRSAGASYSATSARSVPSGERSVAPSTSPVWSIAPLQHDQRPVVYLVDAASPAAMTAGLPAAAGAVAVIMPLERGGNETDIRAQLDVAAAWQRRLGQPEVQVIDLR